MSARIAITAALVAISLWSGTASAGVASALSRAKFTVAQASSR